MIFSANDKKPLEARVTADNANRLTLKWTLKDLRSAKGQNVQEFYFTATYLKKTRQITVTARARNYDNSLSGQGTCADVKKR